MAKRDIVVMGASAGGVDALRRFVPRLPADLAATILVVLHVPPGSPSALPSILRRESALPCRAATDGESVQLGVVAVAPADRHLILHGDKLRVTAGPVENGHRPAIDVLFRTAAKSAGARVIGVVFSGTLDDGTAGAVAIRERGGLVFVQDAEDALYATMPTSVLERAGADGVAGADKLADLVVEACGQEVSDESAAPLPDEEMDIAEGVMGNSSGVWPDAPPSGFTCPDCNGALFVVDEHTHLRFRCRVGHAWTAGNLLHRKDDSVEGALWMAMRALQEKSDLADRLAQRADSDGRPHSSRRLSQSSDDARKSAETIRTVLSALTEAYDETAGPAEDVTPPAGQAVRGEP